MGRRKKWKMDLLSGHTVALILLGAFFFAGSIIGCIAAGLIRDPSGVLFDYIRGYLELVAQDGVTGRFLSVFWETAKFPVIAVLLAFTALGIAGLPLLFAVRGFLLCYALTVFYRLLGLEGLLPGFFLFGLSAVIWMPVLFQLGIRGLLSSYAFLRRATGDGRYPLRCNGGFLICCGICAAALCMCAVIEFFMVPALLQRVTGIFFSG